MSARPPIADPFATLDRLARALLADVARREGWRRGDIAGRAALVRHRRLAAALDDALTGLAEESPSEAAAEIRSAAPALAPHIALLTRCAEALPRVLAGEIAGTDLMFPGGSMDLVAPIYDGSEWADRFNRRAAEAVSRAAVAIAAERPGPVTVVEIGAGTGGTTRHLLPALERARAQAGVDLAYHYTDISAGFLAHGRGRFAGDHPFLHFATLDIERDPTPQGFAAGMADMVVATNVLHATARIADTLEHLAHLLAPSGMLAVNEVTRSSLFATMTFGLLDGWWRFEDPETRLAHSPLLDIAGWQRALAQAGFETPVAIGWDGQVADDFQALLLADRVDVSPAATSPVAEMRRTAPAPASVPVSDLRGAVTDAVATALGLAVSEIETDRPFAELGVDSIVAGQLASALTERLGVAVPASTLFDHATVEALTRHIETLGVRIDPHPETAPEPPPEPARPSVRPSPATPKAEAGDDIAIIGLACRFPGASDIEAFWRNLVDGVDSITEIPPDRFDWRAVWGDGDRSVSRWGGFLAEHDAFDPEVFRLTPSEAAAMSPQQRVFLECTWHALEHAGYGRQELAERSVGVYVGVAPDGYGEGRSDARSSLGDSNAILSARLAYTLDLKGPCLPIDTACSSSLVALHMAARAVADGEAEMALAGGVSIFMRSPRLHEFLSDSGMASPTGRCRTFDAAADGFVPGEGVGVAVLKRLDRAVADGDHVVAVIRGSGVNHDGRTSGITAPSGPAQSALITEVMNRAELDAATVGYVEAHGTGTRLGDPIEVNALTRAYGTAAGPTWIGSVKTNIGHTLTAAGIAGVIKAALAVERGVIPPSLHYQRANPELDLASGRFRVPTRAEPWEPTDGTPRRAAVSSFGFSGTNAHVVLDQPPNRILPRQAGGPRPVFFSARSEAALDAMLAQVAEVIDGTPPTFPALAFTLTAGRTHFEHRAALMVASLDELRAGLAALRQMAPGDRQAAVGRGIVRDHEGVKAGDPVEAFLAGADLDLAALFPPEERHRVPLPGYPFQHERFAPPPTAAAPVKAATLHPLIAENVSDASGLRWRLADGWPALADHRSGGSAIVAAAAMVEILHTAARLAWGDVPVQIADLTLQAPLPVADLARAHVTLAADGDGWRAEIVDGSGASCARASIVVVGAIEEETLTLADTGRRMDADAVYGALQGVGFDYGPAFRTVERLAIADGRVVADLTPDTGERFAWPPALVDGAIQSAVGLALDRFSDERVTVIPAGLERARLFGDLAAARHAVVTERPGRRDRRVVLDIALTDAEGRVLARLDGLAAAIVAAPLTSPADDAVLSFVPRWQPLTDTPSISGDHAETVIVIDRNQIAPPDLPGTVIKATQDWEALFRALDPLPERLVDLRGLADGPVAPTVQMVELIAGWLRARPGAALSILRAHVEDGRVDPDEAALEGLAATLPHEAPEVSLRLLALGRGAGPVGETILQELTLASPEPQVRRFAGRRHGRRWDPIGDDAGPRLDLLDQPVILLTGAYGGLGTAVAVHLARTRRARMVLVGRRDRDGESSLAADVVRAGGQAVDVTADVSTTEGAARAVAAGRAAFGRIDAVLHAAGVTGDQLLRHQSADEAARILAPKIDGLRALLDAAAEEPLRAVVAFGSLAARFGNAGQGVYAAANAAMAALAEREGVPVRVIDWPYWRTGGMAARDDSDARLRAKTGSRWITEDEGLAVLDRVLGQDTTRIAVAAGDRTRVSDAFTGRGAPAPASPSVSGGDVQAAPGDPDRALAVLRDALSTVTGLAPERLGAERTIEDLGLDSMHVMTLNERLEAAYAGVPPTLFYAHRTIGDAAAALAALASAVPSPPPSPVAELAVPAAIGPAPAPRRDTSGGADPIAIVGIAGRFPGAPDLDAFWTLLRDGRDAVTEIPAGRWDVERFHDDRPGRPGRSYSRWGGFIDGVDMFDPVHFGIAPADALRMDPQERLVLEVTAEALEDAGLTRASLVRDAGRRGSVHVGVMYGDYQMLGADQHARGNPVAASAPYWSIANRLSYWLDLHGPSFAVDSACSSSLTAIHLACQALWSGEAEVALAGGVNLSLHPLKYVGLSQGRFASTDGRCRSFAEGGDGYVPGEGVGMVVLKPLAEAEAAGDPIHGVIRGSAVTHGGRTNGYTVPSPDAQASAITAALARAGLDAGRLGYLEAHGTGTALGDPIELDGIARATRGRSAPLAIGTVKASVGHLEAAAGIAGLAKVLLQFRHATLAPTLLHAAPSKALTAAASDVRLVTEVEPWPAGAAPRLAGISSFGAGGANAHLLVEEAPVPVADDGADGPFAFVFSGRNRVQLEAEIRRLLPVLQAAATPGRSADIARTLQLGREALAHRAAVVAESGEAAAETLSAWLGGDGGDGVLAGVPDEDGAGPSAAPPPPGAALDAVVSAWIAGADPDWASQNLPGRRTRIPPRPLLRRRYWPNVVDEHVPEDASVGRTEPDQHAISGDDPILTDHRVQGAPLLPGAASVLILAGDRRRALSGVEFLRPGRAGAEGLNLTVSHTGGEARLQAGGVTVAAAGIDAEGPDSDPEIATVTGGTTVDAAAIYNRFHALGIDYGATFRRLADIRSAGGLAEARLTPAAELSSFARQVSDLDAALQVAAALAPADLDQAGVPASVDRVVLAAEDTPVAVVRARRVAAGVFDLDACADDGRIVARFRGLRVRPMRRAALAGLPPRLLAPVWEERAAAGGGQDLGRVVIAHGSDETGLVSRLTGRLDPVAAIALDAAEVAVPPCDTLVLVGDLPAAAAEWSIERAWRAQALTEAAGALARSVATASQHPRRILLVTAGACDPDGLSAFDPVDAGLPGLVRSLAEEMAGTTLALVDLDAATAGDAVAVDRLLAEPFSDPPTARIAWRGDRRLTERLADVDPGARAGIDDLPANPVCLITGGSGGLGLALARHLVETRGATVILSGRRPALAGALPDGVRYSPADVTDPAAAHELCRGIVAADGRLDAVFHLALVLRDARLATMTSADFAAPLAPKAIGTAAVLAAAEAVGAARAVVFSSANVFAGVAGQANYVAGSGLQDAVARTFRGLMRVQVIDWGLWGEVGAVADAATQTRLRRAGIHPIQPADGLCMLDTILTRDIDRVAVVAAEPAALARLGWRDGPDLSADVAAFKRLEAYGRARLTAALAKGLGGDAGRAMTQAALARRLEVAPRHDALFAALLDALIRDGLVAERDGVVRWPAPDSDPADAVTRAENALAGAPSWIAGPRALLDAVLGAYPEMLAGRVDPLSVMFPGGRGELVATAYRDNPVSDVFNAAAAAAVREAADTGSVVIELGGGTGGGTAAALAALDAGQVPARYLFTDISRQFLDSAAERFAPSRPWFETALYDAERTVEENGLEPGTGDVVVATNMLHAIGDLGAALGEIGRLLAPTGTLVINELVENQDYGTLVFGLTEGWWKGAGGAGRLPHGPVLDADGWRRALEATGFRDVRIDDLSPRGGRGQAVIVAAAPAGVRAARTDGPAATVAAAVDHPAGAGDGVDDELRRALIADLRGVVAGQLALDPDELRAGQSFDAYGLESLSAMAIRDTLDARFGGVSQTLLFEHDSLASLADHLLTTRGEAVRTALGTSGQPTPPVADPQPAPQTAPQSDPAAPIAVIGLAGRFPGAETPADLWRLLEAGGSALGPVPEGRWAPTGWYDPDGGIGRAYTRIGGFLEDIDRFDPLYFGIAPVEAETIDPQERLFLETAWHALENAGTTPARLQSRAGPVGVFVGVMNAGYQWLAVERAAAPATSSYWSIANRLSYIADWSGPSLAVDTACSSSLTALHLAVEALRRGECGAVVVGGVNLIVHPRQLANLSQAHMLSASGECRAFADGADGFVDGEGVAALVLKPLEAALRDGDRVEAVIRGTALNAGGRTSGFAVPSPVAQGRVAADALKRAGIAPESVQVVETHGTGTSLGDPIEVTGLAAAYGGSARTEPLIIGALKANIGHLESAAGVAGVVKAILQLRQRRIAPLRHADQPNPRIDLAGSGLGAPAMAVDWPAPASGPRRIAVSSFGAGGANAHAVLEEAPAAGRSDAAAPARDLLVLSAMDADALARLASTLGAAVSDTDELAALCHTLRVGRRALGLRVAVPVATVAEVRAALQDLATGRLPAGAVRGDGSGETARMLEESAAGRTLLTETLAAGDLDALARFWVEGAEIDWEGLTWTRGLTPVALPGTPFARERYWLAQEAAPAVAASEPTLPARFLATDWRAAPAPALEDRTGPWLLAGGSAEMADGSAAHTADLPDDRAGWDRLIDHLPMGAGGDLVLVIGAGDLHAAAMTALSTLSAVLARPGRVRRVFLACGDEAVATVLAAIAASAAREGLDGRVRTVILPVQNPAATLSEERATEMPGAPLIDRRSARMVRVRRALDVAEDAPPAIAPGSRVLLAGGLGAVGTALARELISGRGAKVGVIGRRPASDAVPADLDIAYAVADLTDAAALTAAVGDIRAALGGIDVVLDLARVVDNAPLAAKDPARAEAVLAVKTHGTEALDLATRKDPLSAFVVFSSLAAWFGLAGGADYAAACAAQDALMAARSGPGRGLSVAWPQWAYDTELTEARRRELDAAGLGTIDAARGLALLDRVLGLAVGAPSASALAIAVGRSHVLDALVDGDAAEPDPEAPDLETMSDGELVAYVARLRAEAGEAPPPSITPPAEPAQTDAPAAIRAAVARHLKVDPSRLAPATAFADLGLDSIKALHVAETLAGALGIEVEPALLVSHPTIAELARALEARRDAPMREAGE